MQDESLKADVIEMMVALSHDKRMPEADLKKQSGRMDSGDQNKIKNLIAEKKGSHYL